jgi:hypothetical protein
VADGTRTHDDQNHNLWRRPNNDAGCSGVDGKSSSFSASNWRALRGHCSRSLSAAVRVTEGARHVDILDSRPMTAHSERLAAHILSLSSAKNFQAACLEWSLESVEISEEEDHCPCGQEIKEHCYLHNRITGHRTFVGNVCVNRFLGMHTGTLFDGLRRIKEDPTANPNLAVIDYAEERGFLHDQEPAFLRRTVRQRAPSDKQKAWKARINRRILNNIVVQKRTQK